MDFYYTDGTTNYGPFSLEQLKDKNITPATRMWHAGMSGWAPASELPELAELLSGRAGMPPPPQEIPRQPSYTTSPQPVYSVNRPPKTWLVESILVTLFCCLPFGIAGIIYAAKVESRHYAGDYQGALQASSEAGKWTKIGFWIGIGILILYIIYFVAIFFFAMNNGSSFEKFTPNF
ncbi:MAG: CD225/dispanin family protein [Bacteroidetes bacterium]|nr:CD225/dispanin family protein [Bacteroidota bacterium]